MRHREVVVLHENDVAVRVEGAVDLFVDPVFLFLVALAPAEGTGGANQQEVSRGPNILEQALVELPSLEAVDIQEDGVRQQLQVNFQETRQPRSITPPVTDKYVQSLLQALLGVSNIQTIYGLHIFYSLHDLDPVDLIIDSTFYQMVFVWENRI